MLDILDALVLSGESLEVEPVSSKYGKCTIRVDQGADQETAVLRLDSDECMAFWTELELELPSAPSAQSAQSAR